MTRASSRTGYTLVELMVASAISLLILAGMGSAFLASHRLISQTMAEAEFALTARDLRDRLLFHAAPDYGGVAYAGLLSLTNMNAVTAVSTTLTGRGAVIRTAAVCGDEVRQEISLSARAARDASAKETASYVFVNAKDTAHPRWLNPFGVGFWKKRDTDTMLRVQADPDTKIRRFHLDLTYRYHPGYLLLSDEKYDYVRTESLLVPLPGKVSRPDFTGDTLEL